MTIPAGGAGLVGGGSMMMMMMDNNNEGSSCVPCTPDEEKQIIKDLNDEFNYPMKEGDVYYLLSNRWYTEWCEYTGQHADDYFSMDDNSMDSQLANGILSPPSPRPAQIDNRHLLMDGTYSNEDDLELRRSLQEGLDYVLVSEQVWKKLYDWYKGGPAIPRKVISQGIHETFYVEVYPLCFQLTDDRDEKQYVIRISKKASLRELYHQVSMLLGLQEEKIYIRDYFNKTKYPVLEVTGQSLDTTHLQMDQDILLEVEPSGSLASGSVDSTGNELALVAVDPSRSSTIAGGPSPSNVYSADYYDFYGGSSLVSPLTDFEGGYNLRKVANGDKGGLAGLQNLGNTCFMNSAIQCLVHTPPLAEYFLDDYSEEINKQNPIGMQGELAISFGDLLRKLWSSGRASIAPRVFKGKLGRFAPQFSGYNQHDSHELLAFLLDGLHEDLNRVKSKPYIELKDAGSRPDEEVANECWEIHKARNNSVIVDVCQGQYKSTLVCPVCRKVSVTFDPFMYLSLPLPSRVTRSMTVTVFSGDGRALPMQYTVSVLKHGCYSDLFQALGTACCLKSDEVLLLAEVYEHGIFRYLENSLDSLSMIKDDEHIVAYRLPKKLEGFTKLEIIHRSEGKKILGTPLVTCLPEGPQSSADIQNAVHMVLSPLSKIKPSSWVHTSMEDESTSGINVDGPIETRNPECGLGEQSLDRMELDQLSSGMVSFNLSLTDDERGVNCSPIENGFHSRPDNVMRVMLDWSDREHDMYDVNYLENLPEVHKTGFFAKKTRQEAISLFSCMEAFLKEEPLGPEDMWYCPTCKQHRQATKKLDLWRLPEILVVHLKRFSYSRYFKNKLETFVSFPTTNLDLSNYVKSKADAPQSHLYELYAVSNHYGGLGGGHYSAYAKLIQENKWYHFDDSHVSPIREDDVKTSAAYVLFYQRVRKDKVDESPQGYSSSG